MSDILNLISGVGHDNAGCVEASVIELYVWLVPRTDGSDKPLAQRMVRFGSLRLQILSQP